MKQLFLFLILSVLLIGVASAVPIVGDELLVADYLSEGVDTIEYEVTPDADKIITVALTGSNGYAPELRIYDDATTVPVETITAARGKTATHTFLSRGEKDDEITYRLVIVVDDGLPGAEFTFSYVAENQNDGDSGVDAPETFADAFLAEVPGTYDGFLGGADDIDMYSIDLLNGETVTFTLTAKDRGSLGIALFDAEGSRKLVIRKSLDPAIDGVLTSSFLSLRDQNVKVNINGDVPYSLSMETDKEIEPEPVIVLPPPPPPPPVMVADDVEEPDENGSFLLLLIIIVVLAGGGVAGIFSWRMKKEKSAAQKKSKKK